MTWYAMYQGVENDKRLAEGEPPVEKQEEDKVWVWPDLVYVELLCMIRWVRPHFCGSTSCIVSGCHWRLRS